MARYIQRYLLLCCGITFLVAGPRPIRAFPCTPCFLSRSSRNETLCRHRGPSQLPDVVETAPDSNPRSTVIVAHFGKRAIAHCSSVRSAALVLLSFLPLLSSSPLLPFHLFISMDFCHPFLQSILPRASPFQPPSCIIPLASPLPLSKGALFTPTVIRSYAVYLLVFVSHRILLHWGHNLIMATLGRATVTVDRVGYFCFDLLVPISRQLVISPSSRSLVLVSTLWAAHPAESTSPSLGPRDGRASSVTCICPSVVIDCTLIFFIFPLFSYTRKRQAEHGPRQHRPGHTDISSANNSR